MRTTSWIIVAASLLGCSGLILGAYGAHGLGNPEAWSSAVRIQTTHALLLMGLAALTDKIHLVCVKVAAALIVFGVFLFSGSIYLNKLGMMEVSFAPYGGSLLMLAWLCIGLGAILKTARA